MPQYFFTVRASEGDATERAAELNDEAAALAYACEIVRELMQSLALADRQFASDREGQNATDSAFNSVPCGVRLKLEFRS